MRIRDVGIGAVYFGLMTTHIAAPFIWGYGALFYCPPLTRLTIAVCAGLWSIPMFFDLKNDKFFDYGVWNAPFIVLSCYLKNIPYLIFRAFYIFEFFFYIIIAIKYVKAIKNKFKTGELRF